jgi:hypothetical protein
LTQQCLRFETIAQIELFGTKEWLKQRHVAIAGTKGFTIRYGVSPRAVTPLTRIQLAVRTLIACPRDFTFGKTCQCERPQIKCRGTLSQAHAQDQSRKISSLTNRLRKWCFLFHFEVTFFESAFNSLSTSLSSVNLFFLGDNPAPLIFF